MSVEWGGCSQRSRVRPEYPIRDLTTVVQVIHNSLNPKFEDGKKLLFVLEAHSGLQCCTSPWQVGGHVFQLTKER